MVSQLVRFFASNNVTVQGLRIENSPQFHLKFDGCEQVRIDGLFISSPALSPNTDGVHVENTSSVQIYNSRINNGAQRKYNGRKQPPTTIYILLSPDP